MCPGNHSALYFALYFPALTHRHGFWVTRFTAFGLTVPQFRMIRNGKLCELLELSIFSISSSSQHQFLYHY